MDKKQYTDLMKVLKSIDRSLKAIVGDISELGEVGEKDAGFDPLANVAGLSDEDRALIARAQAQSGPRRPLSGALRAGLAASEDDARARGQPP